ncbi:MAG: hypothetical protein ABSH56_29435 [Bryobacteraceae bacterium]|jgi:hypothetical protein
MALATLAVFSVLAGAAIAWVFRIASNRRALEVSRRRMRAHLLAMRLFGGDPVVVLGSEARLLAWSARYMALLLPPFLVVAIPLFFAWDSLDAVWGRAPLAPGDTTLITARLRGDLSGAQLTVPPFLAIESPPVRVPSEREVSWRVRVLEKGSGEAMVRVETGRAGRRIDARPGLPYLPERTAMAAGPIEWIEVRYPRAAPSLAGVSANWVVWFCLISTVTALALRRGPRIAVS